MKEYVTVKDLARDKAVSTTAVYKKIYSGQLRAERIGHQYLILRKDADELLFRRKKRVKKGKKIQKAVSRAVNEHVNAFRLLGED